MLKETQEKIISRLPKGRAFLTAAVIASMFAMGSLLTPPAYEASALISFNPGQIQDEWDLMRDETRVIDFEEQVRSRAVLIPALEELGMSPAPSQGLIERLGLARFFPQNGSHAEQVLLDAVEAFQRDLSVERNRQSSLLRITVKKDDPQLAARAANAVALAFIDLKRQQYLAKSQERTAAIEREMTEIQNDLARAMEQRSAFLKDQGWDDYQVELSLATNQVSLLKQNLALYESFKVQDDMPGTDDHALIIAPGHALAPDQPQDGNLNQLIQQWNEAETRFLQIKSRFKEDSPPVLQITRERKELEKSIGDYVKSRKVFLAAQLEAAQKEHQKLLSAGPKMETFQASIDHTEQRFQDLLNQRSAIRLQMAAAQEKTGNFGDLRLLDRAMVPPTGSPVKRLVKIVAGAVASFAVTFCLILIAWEIWRQSLNYLAQQQKRTIDPFDKLL